MPPRGDDEACLMARARAGEVAAFDTLAQRCRPHLYRLALRRLGDPETALDCVQETLLRAFESLPRFREQCSVVTWLHRILDHVCSEERRRLARCARGGESVDLAHDLGLEEAVAQRDEFRRALQALGQLPLPLRTASLLSLVEGHSHAETGAILGISTDAVKMRVSRARALLTLDSASPQTRHTVHSALAEGYQLIGTLALKQGRDEESDRAVLRAIRHWPISAYKVWQRYDRARGTPLYRPAKAQADRVLAQATRWPDNATARVVLANFLHFEQHRWAEAEQLYASAASDPAVGVVARAHLGDLYVQSGRPGRAVPLLAGAVRDDPESPFAVAILAHALAMARAPGALAWARRARAAALRGYDHPDESPRGRAMQTGRVQLYAADALFLLGDVRAARQLALTALRTLPEGYVDNRPQRMLARLGGGAA